MQNLCASQRLMVVDYPRLQHMMFRCLSLFLICENHFIPQKAENPEQTVVNREATTSFPKEDCVWFSCDSSEKDMDTHNEQTLRAYKQRSINPPIFTTICHDDDEDDDEDDDDVWVRVLESFNLFDFLLTGPSQPRTEDTQAEGFGGVCRSPRCSFSWIPPT